MNELILNEALICPVCGGRMSYNGRSLVCASGHTYDVAKSGYVNLAGPKQQGGGDSSELIKARTEFLTKGYYERFSDAVNGLIDKYLPNGIIADAGCGEGYYTQRTCDHCRAVFGFDLSKCGVENGAKSAKKSGKDILYAVAGIYSIPLADSSVDGIVNIFAPCAEKEFSRVLKKDGHLIVACAGRDHLHGLKELLYDKVNDNEIRADLPCNMELVEKINVSFDIKMDNNNDIISLFSMTPYYYKTGTDAIEKLSRTDSLSTVVDFDIFVYKNI